MRHKNHQKLFKFSNNCLAPIATSSGLAIIVAFGFFIASCEPSAFDNSSARAAEQVHQFVSPNIFINHPLLLDHAIEQCQHILPTALNFKMKEQTAVIGNAPIRYLETGSKGNQTILLLHGATFRAELWKNLGTMKFLAKNSYHVISADLPKHGKSGNPKISKDEFLKTFIQHTNLNNPVVLGHSFAGSYIWPYLIEDRDSSAAAILVAPTHIKEYLPQLSSITKPILIIWGEKDEMIPVQQAFLLNKMLPNSRLKILKGEQHECYVNSKIEFHSIIFDFLTGVQK